jgi:Uma2 family endonuclease
LLPNGAERSPDASWISLARWDALTRAQRRSFPPLCPDFVIELKSPSDSLASLQEKLEEYIACGARLGWLLDPDARTVHVYRPNSAPNVLNGPSSVDAAPELPGFVLDLSEVW